MSVTRDLRWQAVERGQGPRLAHGPVLGAVRLADLPADAPSVDRGNHVRIFEEVRARRHHGIEALVVTSRVGPDVPAVRDARTRRLPWVRRRAIGFPSTARFSAGPAG